jgi:lipopolysaccharide export system protein LptC
MAVGAEHSVASARPTGRSERRAVFQRARRHSRLVRLLRVVFPLCAVAILGLYFFSSGLTVAIGDMEASVSSVEIDKDRLRMVDPKMEGVTEDKGAYRVTAEYAEQEIANPNIVHLSEVRARLDNPSQGWIRLTSPQGVFDTNKEMLELTGDIKVSSSSGMTSHLTRAELDMSARRAVSDEPVLVEAMNGTINAESMELLFEERRVIFRGDVRVHIFKRPPETKQKNGRES